MVFFGKNRFTDEIPSPRTVSRHHSFKPILPIPRDAKFFQVYIFCQPLFSAFFFLGKACICLSLRIFFVPVFWQWKAEMKFVINLQMLAKFCIRCRVIGSIIIIISNSPTEVDQTSLRNFKHETCNFGKFEKFSLKLANLTQNFPTDFGIRCCRSSQTSRRLKTRRSRRTSPARRPERSPTTTQPRRHSPSPSWKPLRPAKLTTKTGTSRRRSKPSASASLIVWKWVGLGRPRRKGRWHRPRGFHRQSHPNLHQHRWERAVKLDLRKKCIRRYYNYEKICWNKINLDFVTN